MQILTDTITSLLLENVPYTAGATSLNIMLAQNGEKTMNPIDAQVESVLKNAMSESKTDRSMLVYTRVPRDYADKAIRCCDGGHPFTTQAFIFGVLNYSDFMSEWFNINGYKFTDTDVAIYIPAGTGAVFPGKNCRSFGDSAVILAQGIKLYYAGIEKHHKKKMHTFVCYGGTRNE